MRFNAHKEEMLFNIKKPKKHIHINYQSIDNVIKDIDKIKNNKENIYIYESGHEAKFLYERSCINDLSLNYFQLYNKNVHAALRKIISGTYEICKENDINIDKISYFLSSEYEDNLSNQYIYDSGGHELPMFYGYWFLKTKENSSVKILDQTYPVEDGSIIVVASGSKIEFLGPTHAISFNISNLSKIERQYPQKWLPIFLAP